MRAAYFRICRLLASSGFRDHEIAEFAHVATQVPAQALVDDVAQLRKLLKDSDQVRIFDTPSDTPYPPQRDVEVKIERLLIEDAGLPRTVAIEQLTSAIRSRYPNISVPPESRKGFRSWIRKLTALVQEKELLYIATTLRNHAVNEAPSDWRLK